MKLMALFPTLAIVLVLLAIIIVWILGRKRKFMNPNSVMKEESIEDIPSSEVVSQMKLMLKYFSGNMNVLEGLVADPNPVEGNIIFNNLQQTISVHGSETLKKWFSWFNNDRKSWDAPLYSDKAREILSMLKQCGLKKKIEIRITWSKSAEMSYRKIGEIEYGQECEVIDSYWELEEKVFEKGIVKKV